MEKRDYSDEQVNDKMHDIEKSMEKNERSKRCESQEKEGTTVQDQIKNILDEDNFYPGK